MSLGVRRIWHKCPFRPAICKYGHEASLKAMEMAVENGNVNKSDVTVLAARITGYGIETPPENGPNLSIYDELFIYGQNTLSEEVHAS